MKSLYLNEKEEIEERINEILTEGVEKSNFDAYQTYVNIENYSLPAWLARMLLDLYLLLLRRNYYISFHDLILFDRVAVDSINYKDKMKKSITEGLFNGNV